MGKAVWQPGVIQSILSNVKYKGVTLCWAKPMLRTVSEKVRINGGERPAVYENNHPAIIDADTFTQVQEELARRASKRRSSRSARQPNKANTAESTHSPNCLSAENAGTPYADARTAGGQKEVYGAVSTALTTAKNTVTTHRLWKKPRRPL